jgi:hypothetical protein
MQTTTRKSRKYLATPIFGVLMGVVYLVAFRFPGIRSTACSRSP